MGELLGSRVLYVGFCHFITCLASFNKIRPKSSNVGHPISPPGLKECVQTALSLSIYIYTYIYICNRYMRTYRDRERERERERDRHKKVVVRER